MNQSHQPQMYSIGEFSLITQLSIKTLRFYHKKGVLIPDYIDPHSSYRFYSNESIKIARNIRILRQLDLPISEVQGIFKNNDINITEILSDHQDILEQEKTRLSLKIKQVRDLLDDLNSNDKAKEKCQIEEKILPDVLYASYKMTGKYADIAYAFRKVADKTCPLISGKPIALYYDKAFKEDNATFEGGYPVSSLITDADIRCRVLKGGSCISLLHKGAYETLASSYKKMFHFAKHKGYTLKHPHREYYLVGPGILDQRPASEYITQIVFQIKK